MKKILAIEYNGKIINKYYINDINDIIDEEINNFLININNQSIDVLPLEYYPQYNMVIRIEDCVNINVCNNFITNIEIFLKNTWYL